MMAGGGLQEPETQNSLSPPHTLQSSTSSQHTSWKHPPLLPIRGDQGLSSSRVGSDKGGFSHVLCVAVSLSGSTDQGGGMGGGSLSSGRVNSLFCNPTGFFNRQPTDKPNLGAQHYQGPFAEGGKDTCPFLFSLADKQRSRDI